MHNTHYEQAIDITDELAAGDVTVSDVKGESFLQLGILIARGQNVTEDIEVRPVGANAWVTLNLVTGTIHPIKVSAIRQAGSTANNIQLLGI